MKTCSILLVNDDPQVIAAVHEALAGVRYQLIVGPTAIAAVAALDQRGSGFDGLLVDLDVGLDGLALLSAVRTTFPQLPIIALVPPDEWFLKEEAFLRGALVLLDKPVGTGDFAVAVQQICGCTGRRFMRRPVLQGRRIVNAARGSRP